MVAVVSMLKVQNMSFKNSSILHSHYVKWPFSCQVNRLPNIWTVVLLKFICVMNVVQDLFSYQTSLAHF